MDQEQKREWERKIIIEAWKNPRFKEELLSNPQEALRKLHCPCPAECKVKVVEETDESWTIVIPKSPVDMQKLSEADLALMAGGTAPPIISESYSSCKNSGVTWVCGCPHKK